ncbi:MAG TPA: MgtC/SapB family protein [Arenimonas sp.]
MTPITADALPLLPLGTALGVGLLVGAVRERRHPDRATSAGLRTHALAALSGAVALWLGLAVFVVVVAMAGLFAAMSYRLSRAEDPGLTGEITLVLTTLLGGLALGLPALAGGLGVVVAALVYLKGPLHQLARERVSEAEVRDGLVLLASALVVLPLVPDRSIGPFDVFNPAMLWKLVVLVMAISALGHVALRLVGNRWGLAMAGFFAGYVSSTAAVAGFGQRVRETPALRSPAVGAAMLANLASLSLFVPILLAVSPALLSQVGAELAVGGAVLLAGGLLGLRPDGQGEPPPTAQSRMFRFRHALLFAVIITAVLFASAALNAWLGPRGAMAGATLAALAEVHAAAATVAKLSASGAFDADQARWAIVLLLAASSVAKSVVAFASGGPGYGLRVAAGLAAMVAATAAVAWFG